MFFILLHCTYVPQLTLSFHLFQRNSNEVELDVDRFIKDMESVVGPVWHKKAVHDADFDEGSTSSLEMDFGMFCFLFS